MAQKIPQVRILAFNNEDIGMGFNSDTGLAVGTALDFDLEPRDVAQQAIAEATIVTTHESLMETLNISSELKGHYTFSSADLKADYSKATGYNSISTFVVAKMVINNQLIRGKNFRVNSNAKAVLDLPRTDPNVDPFAEAFGDCFVRGRFTGGEFYAVMRITSTDTSVQTELALSLQADINQPAAGGDFTGTLKQKNTEGKSRSEFSASFFQRGGSGEAEIGATLSPDEINARLRNFPNAVVNHPLPYEIEVATYDTVPIPTKSKEQQDDFLLALADADEKKLRFIQIRNDLEFAASNPDFFDNLPARELLLADAEVFLQLANAAIAHAVKLSQGQIPPQLFDPAKLTPPILIPIVPALRKKVGGLEKNFVNWWLFKDLVANPDNADEAARTKPAFIATEGNYGFQ